MISTYSVIISHTHTHVCVQVRVRVMHISIKKEIICSKEILSNNKYYIYLVYLKREINQTVTCMRVQRDVRPPLI